MNLIQNKHSVGILLLILLSFFPSKLLSNTASIQGRVSLVPSGEYLSGVNILLRETSDGSITDGTGRFQLRNITPGKYTIQASYLGFNTEEQSVQIRSGEELVVNFVLEEKSHQMNELKVVAQSPTTAVNHQAFAVSAVSTEAFLNSSASVHHVLNRIGGVRVMEEGGLGSRVSFSLNGFTGDQVKFFMDGIPMDNFGTSLSLSDLSLSMIERIEVYKGVVPIWLGTDALGGAVNIITNRKQRFFDASYSLGSFNTHRVAVNKGFTSPKGFITRINAFYNYSDNNYEVLAAIANAQGNIYDTLRVRRFHDAYRSGTVQAEWGVVGKPYADQLLLGAIVSGNNKEIQHGITMRTVYGGVVQNSSSKIATLKYNKRHLFTEGLSLNINSALNQTKTENIDTLRGVSFNWLGERFVRKTSDGKVSNDGELGKRSFLTMRNREATAQVNAAYVFNANSSIALNYAYSYYHRKMFDSEDPENIPNRFPKSMQKNILGIAYKFDQNNQWNATAFAKLFHIHSRTSREIDFALATQRVEGVQNSSKHVGYGVASTYYFNFPLQLKFSYENTYRLPHPSEIFGDGLFILPNADLKPERSHNVNLGFLYQHRFNAQHSLHIGSCFILRDAKNLIYTVPRVASPQTFYDNLSHIRTLGVEGNFLYEWNSMFTVSGSLTFQDMTDRAKWIYNQSYTGTGWQRNFLYGFRLPNKPYLFGHLRTSYQVPPIGLKNTEITLNHQFNFAEQYYLTWNRFNHIIPRQMSHDFEAVVSFGNGKYNLSLECKNIFDKDLFDKYYLQKPGRAFYMKFRYSI